MLRALVLSGVALLSIATDVEAAGAFFRTSIAEPTRVEQAFVQKCSFRVQPLDPGSYVARADVIGRTSWLWIDEPAGHSNRWLYSHRAGDCRATLGRTGYRYTWLQSSALYWSMMLEAVGGRATVMADGIRLDVTEPIWLSGEIGTAFTFERVGR